MLRYPNRVAQTGTHYTGSPDYVNVSGGSALSGRRTFPVVANAQSWITGDLVHVLVKVDDSNWALWEAEWDASNSYLELSTELLKSGTLGNAQAVDVHAVVTQESLLEIATAPVIGQFVENDAVSLTLSEAHAGRVIRCTSASPTTVTIDDSLPVGFHCVVAREGAGTVTLEIEGSDTVNGDTAGIPIAKQWGTCYVYQPDESAWVVIA